MKYVVVGGGIAGVCATEELQRLAPPASTVTLVSVSPSLKGVGNVVRLTQNLEEFEVVEKDLASIAAHPNTRVIVAAVVNCDCKVRRLWLPNGEQLEYDKLLCATGAVPKVLSDHPAVLTLRDTDSVLSLRDRLQAARRVIIVGNGGIALELVGALKGMLDVVWVLKHGHVGDAFFDVDAASFLLKQLEGSGVVNKDVASDTVRGREQTLQQQQQQQQQQQGTPQESQEEQQQQQQQQQLSPHHALHATHPSCSGRTTNSTAQTPPGHAAGPKWTQNLRMGIQEQAGNSSGGTVSGRSAAQGGLLLELNALVDHISSADPRSTSSISNGSVKHEHQQDPQEQHQEQQRVLQGAETRGQLSARQAGSPGSHDQHLGMHCDSREPLSCSREEGVLGSEEAWPVYATLTNGKVIGADIIVSAIGVTPATQWLPPELARASDGGLLVDGRLCCLTGSPANHSQVDSAADANANGAADDNDNGAPARAVVPPHSVFAAGDCCTIPEEYLGPHFFQMRLWTQARIMGIYAAHCMVGMEEEFGSSFGLELFTHATRFFGLKVVLLGLYNGQRLDKEPSEDIQIYIRQLDGDGDSHDDGPSFVRVLLLRGRMQG
ncbi:hypothetical protein DUNSADRAFT_12644 [Dunaliella salina]|uniref:FAD/NAD(P)-binding domain-containing protein n=1 Tax=Dunaliella salina TaxID=3046 RepID=A0ABQ7H3R0_DUNSA|nr:hypothetical protein DUNSADRAFT_12644 [Dunaliella salina]|eukprot:KAF5841479.1 hypothetical protein DUNSADRAFT_12644 [Dunaliella salina]